MRAFAISDIHGCNTTFKSLLSKIKLEKSDKLFLLGDYIDRGPDSKGVVDTILNLMDKGYNLTCLKGNHEDYIDADPGSPSWKSWQVQGGQATLDSFKVDNMTQIENRYLDFFNNLEYYTSFEDYLLVHAGFNWESKKPFKDTQAMMWIRGMDYNKKKAGGKKIVHGHTPQPLQTALKAYKKNDKVINIDCGCVYRHKEGMGYLCAFELTSTAFYIEQNLHD